MSDQPLTVHRLSIADVAIAQQLASDVLGEPRVAAAKMTELLEDARSIVLAARHNDTSIGYLVAYCFPSLGGQQLAYLYDIEVNASFRRQGTARLLVQRLLEICRQRGVASIWVGSSLTNLAACELWRTTGAQRGGDQYVEFTYDLT